MVAVDFFSASPKEPRALGEPLPLPRCRRIVIALINVNVSGHLRVGAVWRYEIQSLRRRPCALSS